MDITDNELAGLVAAKNEDAFSELVRRYERLIRAIVKYHLKDISMWQEDCINDILFAVWQNIDRFDAEKNSLKNWIGAVAKYRSINYKKKFYRELTAGELTEDMTDGKGADAYILAKEIEAETISLLSGLNPDDREIFIQRYFMEEKIETIAERNSRSPSWIYNRLSRGRKKLRRIYRWSDCHEK